MEEEGRKERRDGDGRIEREKWNDKGMDRKRNRGRKSGR
jgi:hypothetical protein